MRALLRKRVVASVAVALGTASSIGVVPAVAHPVTTGTGAPAAVTTAGAFLPVTPSRILDTRSGVGAPASAVGAGASVTVQVLGAGGVPSSGVSAVVFNLTVVDPAVGGYVSAFPSGRTDPGTSSINFSAGQTRAHLVVVEPGPAGAVTLRNGAAGAVNLLADVSGYYTAGTPTAGGAFMSLPPLRVLDTRIGLGAPQGPLSPGQPLSVGIDGNAGVPASGVSAVVLNLTATQAAGPGYVQATAAGTSSNVNFVAGTSVSNLVVATVNIDGAIDLRSSGSAVQLAADVAGYFLAGSPAGAGLLGPEFASRLIDTRTGGNAPVPAHGTLTVAVAGHQGVPSTGISAAALNVTVARPRATGYLTAYPSGTARPGTSTVNFTTHTVPNLVVAPLGSDGKVTFYNGSSAPVQLVVDVSAFVGPIPGPLSWSGPTPIPGETQARRLACGTATFCVAAAGRDVSVYDGHTWGAEQAITDGDQEIIGLSCAGADFCIALTQTEALTYNGSTWTATDVAVHDAGLEDLRVSCTSATFCVMAEATEDTIYAWVYRGSTWAEVDTALTDGTQGFALSCASSTFCVATNGFGRAQRFNGTAWVSIANRAAFGVETLSCVSPVFCAVGGGDKVATFNGSVWSAPATISVDLTASNEVATLACASASLCLATTTDGRVSIYTGTSWTNPIEVDPEGDPSGVACVTTSLCILADSDSSIVGT